MLALLDPSKAAAAPAAAPSRRRSTAPAAPAAAAAPAAGPKSTPTARNVAREHDVKLEAVPASGPRVTKQDVREFVAGAAPAAPLPPAAAGAARPRASAAAPAPAVVRAPGERTEERVRMTKRRATIARRLVEAQRTAAMLTTFNEVDMSAVMALRERRKEALPEAARRRPRHRHRSS